jgi:hypothetical protein
VPTGSSEVVFTLNKNCTGSACSTNDSADRCAFPTAGNGANDGADSRGNARALDRLRGLVAACALPSLSTLTVSPFSNRTFPRTPENL